MVMILPWDRGEISVSVGHDSVYFGVNVNDLNAVATATEATKAARKISEI